MAGPEVTIPDAVVAASQASVPGVVVYDGLVPATPADRYAVVYVDNGTLRALAVCGESDTITVRWQITSVAPDRQRAAWIATRIRDTTVDTRPVAAGWGCGQITHVYSQPPQRDEAVQERPVVYAVDQYELLANRV
jgi:hypothetical protein